MRVLIVDDCELSAGMLAVVLEIYGHEVQAHPQPRGRFPGGRRIPA